MDLKDCVTLASCLICDVVHVGRQADSSTLKELKIRFHYEGLIFLENIQAQRYNLLFI